MCRHIIDPGDQCRDSVDLSECQWDLVELTRQQYKVMRIRLLSFPLLKHRPHTRAFFLFKDTEPNPNGNSLQNKAVWTILIRGNILIHTETNTAYWKLLNAHLVKSKHRIRTYLMNRYLGKERWDTPQNEELLALFFTISHHCTHFCDFFHCVRSGQSILIHIVEFMGEFKWLLPMFQRAIIFKERSISVFRSEVLWVHLS